MRILLFALLLASCQKETIEPIYSNERKSKTEQPGIIDENFFEKGSEPKINCIEYNQNGSCTLELIPPIVNGTFEVKYICAWDYIRVDKGGVRTQYGEVVKLKPFGNVILTFYAVKLGTNIKSKTYSISYQ